MKYTVKYRNITIGCIIGLFLVITDYLIVNTGYPIFDDIDTLGLTEFYAHHEVTPPYNDDDIVFINVGYDKALAHVIDDGDTIGQLDVTDREKLLHLMNIAKEADYKYMFVDVRFPKQLHTASDSALFATMSGLEKIAISTHAGQEQIDERLAAISGYADYGVTLTTGFTRYQLMQNGGKSIAMKMYEDLDGGSISRHGLLYFSGGSVCFNNMFVPVPSDVIDSFDPNKLNVYMRLGAQLFRYDTDDEIREMIRDKYVIVGDFDNDIHTTYAGDIPGAMLSVLAYFNVSAGHHKVSIWLFMLQWALYSLIAWKVISTPSFSDILKRAKWEKYPRLTAWANKLGAINAPVLRFILLYFTWSFALTMLNIAYYLMFSILITTAIPSLCFTVISQIKASRQ